MSDFSRSAKRVSEGESLTGSFRNSRSFREKQASHEELDKVFAAAGQSLRDGHSSEAEKLLTNTIQTYSHTAENLANLKRLLSFTLETVGRYKESLDAVRPYEDEDMRSLLSKETQVRVTTQLAVAYNNFGDHPK